MVGGGATGGPGANDSNVVPGHPISIARGDSVGEG
jgi:hypothetical protein